MVICNRDSHGGSPRKFARRAGENTKCAEFHGVNYHPASRNKGVIAGLTKAIKGNQCLISPHFGKEVCPGWID